MLPSKDTIAKCRQTVKLDTGPSDPLVDDVIRIHVSGSVPRAKITVHVTVKEGKYTYASSGCYYADDNGKVDVGETPSVLGTYTGKDKLVSCVSCLIFALSLIDIWSLN
ncbi:MAG: acyl-CoA thioesterase/BAAT N-terminal domain-containing protein [Candidatus Thiodiazotropha sp.]